MLSSQHKAHDPLAGELIRTFRHQYFHGKFYLDRYNALVSDVSTISISSLLPARGMSQEVPDPVVFYGFRSTHAALFYLSPWEVCQWFIPHRLRPPSAHYNSSVWTMDGKRKAKEYAGEKV